MIRSKRGDRVDARLSPGLRNSRELLKLDPESIVDFCEEHLAALAVACADDTDPELEFVRYLGRDHFFRSVPLVDLSKSDRGEIVELRADGVALGPKLNDPSYDAWASAEDEWSKTLDRELDESILGERLSYSYTQRNSKAVTTSGEIVDGISWSFGAVGRVPKRYDRDLVRWYGREVRGLGKALSIHHLHVTPSGLPRASSALVFEPVRGRYVDISGVPLHEQSLSMHVIRDAYRAQFERRYDWTIEVALSPDRTGVGLATDRDGAADFLAHREKTNGRRLALVHWVREHYRRGRRDDGDLVKVRDHLRGRTECRWGGYHCRVYPSRYDMERACNRPLFEQRLTVSAVYPLTASEPDNASHTDR